MHKDMPSIKNDDEGGAIFVNPYFIDIKCYLDSTLNILRREGDGEDDHDIGSVG